MNKRTIRVLIISLLVTSGLYFTYFKIDKFLKVDACLDHGGRWNYETNECESSPDTLGQLKGYNELLVRDDSTTYTTSAYNADLPKAENMKRLEQSLITNSTRNSMSIIWASSDKPLRYVE